MRNEDIHPTNEEIDQAVREDMAKRLAELEKKCDEQQEDIDGYKKIVNRAHYEQSGILKALAVAVRAAVSEARGDKR